MSWIRLRQTKRGVGGSIKLISQLLCTGINIKKTIHLMSVWFIVASNWFGGHINLAQILLSAAVLFAVDLGFSAGEQMTWQGSHWSFSRNRSRWSSVWKVAAVNDLAWSKELDETEFESHSCALVPGIWLTMCCWPGQGRANSDMTIWNIPSPGYICGHAERRWECWQADCIRGDM